MENNGFINIDITSTCQHLAQGLGNFIGGISSFAGNILGELSYQLLPPFVQDPFCLLAHVMVNGTIRGFIPSYSQQHSTWEFIPGAPNVEDDQIGTANGIETSYEEAKNDAYRIAAYHNGSGIFLFYNASHGLVTDLGESFLHLLGIPTNSVLVFADMIKAMNEYYGYDSMKTIYAHSQGGLIPYVAIRCLSEVDRKCIRLITFGSAWLAYNGYGDHFNIVYPFDLIPVVANIFNPTLRVVNPGWWKVLFNPLRWKHAFSCDFYKNSLLQIIAGNYVGL